MIDNGCTTAMVAKQLALRQELVRNYCSEFRKSGFDGLIHMEKPGKETLLTEEIFQSMENYMRNMEKKCSMRDLTCFLLKEYNISISEEWLSKRIAMRKQALRKDPWR
ncbi:MAG: hypothetical protein KGJ07_04985 [Patescibacteria group bacterium]|nr:hypothetical protein [Patescibacteria group bacterium]